MITNQQLLSEVRHPEPLESLVVSIPVKDGEKLSESGPVFETNQEAPWEVLRGLGWLIFEDGVDMN